MDRTARAASSRASSERSSEYEKAVLSPDTARTPTPCSMPKLPLLTMPSSSEYDSLRVYWKYRSAKSARFSKIVPSACMSLPSSRPYGSSSRPRAMARRSKVESVGFMAGGLGIRCDGPRERTGYAWGLFEDSMRERRKVGSHLGNYLGIDRAYDNPRPFVLHGHYLAPRVDQHRVAEGCPTVLVPAALGR